MTDLVFQVAGALAMVGWLALIFLPARRWANAIVPVAIPALLGAVYTVLLAVSLPGSEGGYGSLGAVAALFADPRALLAGWVHYLAFDLFLGGWQVRDARRHGVPHLLVVPALVMTFLFGPAGLLLYLVVRSVVTRSRPARRPAR
jgi:hypothetical protein